MRERRHNLTRNDYMFIRLGMRTLGSTSARHANYASCLRRKGATRSISTTNACRGLFELFREARPDKTRQPATGTSDIVGHLKKFSHKVATVIRFSLIDFLSIIVLKLICTSRCAQRVENYYDRFTD